MPGVKGQPHPIHKTTVRQMMWQTMRIKARGFTIPDLLVTVPGATRDNAEKFIRRLAGHGLVRGVGLYVGGRSGEYKRYRLRNDTGPRIPAACPYCKKRLTDAGCGGMAT